MKKRAAVVGVGYLGRFHAQKYKTLSQQPQSQVELVAVCDLHAPQAELVAQELQVQAVTDPKKLIGMVDMVSIATITPVHFQLAKYFLENGVHVNVEKPICLNTKESEQLLQLARDKNLVLSVGHSERFNPAFQNMKKHIQDKSHKLLFLELNRYAPFKRRGSDVSALHDLMIHDLDLMRALVGQEKIKLLNAVAGKLVTDSIDWCSATFQIGEHLRCQINCSRVAKEMTRTIRAIGSHNIYFANLQTGDFESALILADNAGVTSQGNLTYDQPVQFETINVGRGDNLLTETEAFVAAVCGYSLPSGMLTVRGEDGHMALQLVEEIFDYLQTEQTL